MKKENFGFRIIKNLKTKREIEVHLILKRNVQLFFAPVLEIMKL